MDPDAQLAPVMRGHAKAVWYPWMQMQKFYFVLLPRFEALHLSRSLSLSRAKKEDTHATSCAGFPL